MRPAIVLAASLLASGLAFGDTPRPAGPPAGKPTATATPAPSPTKPAGLRNTVRWKTASELNNVGFDVYRAASEDGPFERLTAKPVPGAGTTDEPRAYAWVDDTIEAGKEYWYYVESISMSGVREKFTPTFKAPVKHAAPASPEPARTPAP